MTTGEILPMPAIRVSLKLGKSLSGQLRIRTVPAAPGMAMTICFSELAVKSAPHGPNSVFISFSVMMPWSAQFWPS